MGERAVRPKSRQALSSRKEQEAAGCGKPRCRQPPERSRGFPLEMARGVCVLERQSQEEFTLHELPDQQV